MNTPAEVETAAEEYFNMKLLQEERRKKNQRVPKRKKMSLEEYSVNVFKEE
jgi:hypothetical protein